MRVSLRKQTHATIRGIAPGGSRRRGNVTSWSQWESWTAAEDALPLKVVCVVRAMSELDVEVADSLCPWIGPVLTQVVEVVPCSTGADL